MATKRKRTIPAAPAKDAPGIKNPYVRFRPLEKPRIAKHETTLWDYPSQHYGKDKQGDPNYRGATPSHVVWNVIARYTKPGDLIIDPFVGSGTSLDVARDLDRRAKGFDLHTSRSDVVIADARTALTEHVDAHTAHLVFMDPPYADNLSYSDDLRCIGKRAFEDGSWSDAMGKVIDGAIVALKPGGHLAMFVSDVLHVQQVKEKTAGRTSDRTERRFAALGVELFRLAMERGLMPVDHIAVVRHGKAMDDPRLRAKADAQHFLLRGFSHLVVFQKPTTTHASPKWKRTAQQAAAQTPWTNKHLGSRPQAAEKSAPDGGREKRTPPAKRRGSNESVRAKKRR